MKKLSLLGWVLALFTQTQVFGQGAYIPFNRDYYHLIERYELLEGPNNPTFHTGFKPYRRDHVGIYLDSLSQSPSIQSAADRFNLAYLANDNWEFVAQETADSQTPLLKHFYQKPSDFYHYRDDVFDIHVNPVIHLAAGREPGFDNFRLRNSRGLEFRGSIDRKIAFYAHMTTNQVIFPSWVKDYIEHSGAVPGEGFWKRYNQEGYGFFSAMGHISFDVSKHIQAQIGHDRNFVGEGFRSMILSDFSNPYMFVKLNTNIWKLNLTNVWGQMTADVTYDFAGRPTDDRYPQKWFAMHRLGANIGKRLNIGIFESVMMNQFSVNYLNPIIFYRWVEHQLGSPDKIMLGTDAKWNFAKGMQLYGQFALDEFVFGEFFGIDGRQSSRNKYGLQAGYKYINAFKVSNLDLQLEYNQARPYTYQEKFDFQSFTNFRTPLTHPLGANFREAIGILRYQPIPRLQTNLTGMYQFFGDDPSPDVNFGRDLLKNRLNTNTGIGLFGHRIGQGIENKVVMAQFTASYMWKQNIFLDISHTYRRQTAQDLDAPATTNFTNLALRINMVRKDYLF